MDTESSKDTPIKSWWRKVTHNSNNKPTSSQKQEDQIFGVPLQDSLRCARAAIAYVDNDIQYVGFIPVIVAKCGSFLKDQGLYTEGVFRMSGSAKRIGQLQHIFNTPPDYGRQLDWKGFSVHDAANVLRRYLNYLPEPVIVHQLYQPFRDVILTDNTSDEEKVSQFQSLIEQLPEHHQYLLFYLLDLISLFSQNVQITKMDTFNLASVFTPGMLLNPEHALNPAQYKTSQRVVQFLVEHQHCFKMPRSSRFTMLNQQQKETETETKDQHNEISNTTETVTNNITITTSPLSAPHRHNSHPTSYNTTHTFNTTNTNNNTNNNTINNTSNHPYHHHHHHHHHQKSVDWTGILASSSNSSRPLSVIMSSGKEQRVKRAKTMPSRRSRYGPNDPLQIVQLNRSIIEAGHNK
ncbi:Rho GTPase activation protein [Cokeromyces recurvatus]|uniref:Rho GTPase activation protein n=1 Tax=Cokeromyces recurvatus TaxID=90255 RepID=UPI00221E95B7|nr:Rho GTPase activation protein [Cokeromyces recurvatus]KAI7901869.1 Rho GTPase activation protein [Cokeromyces recurvatus]